MTKTNHNLEKLIKKTKWWYLNNDITTKNFPVPNTVETDNPILLKFDTSFTSEEALERCKKEGLRPANLYELLLYKESNPEAWPDNTWTGILAFGQTWTDSVGNHRVPGVNRDSGGGWGFGLGGFGVTWGADFCLLCFRDPSLDTQTLSKPESSDTLPFELTIDGYVYRRNRKA